MRRKKGQSILEYVIVLTVIVAAIAAAAGTAIKPAITNSYDNVNTTMTNATDLLPK